MSDANSQPKSSIADMVSKSASKSASDFIEVADFDRDSLYSMSLSIVPIQTPALRRARLIKNVRLVGVIEMFTDAQTGSGQLNIDDLDKEFGWSADVIHPDHALLRKLARLPSYDVYSLRILLRDLDIEVNNYDALRLSESKSRELTEYMRVFTGPLMRQVYGQDDMVLKNFDDVIKLFKNPDRKMALEKLRQLAKSLDIDLIEVPKFLEDYGDIFLSLAYYKQCLDSITSPISEFLESLDEIRTNFQLRNDRHLMQTCDQLEATMNELLANITGRFESFHRSSETMWENISAERFRKVEALIRTYHTSIGGVLCSLAVKMNAWSRQFPTPTSGGPIRRSEFIMSEMRQGIEKMQQIDDQAPMMSQL